MKVSYDDLKLVTIEECPLGKGVFANMDFVKGNIIFMWEGRIMKGNYPWYEGERWLQIGEHEWIDPYPHNPGYYINHSCDPNCGIKWSRNIVAMRDIKAGEEITIDYSTTESEEGWHLVCLCGNKNCRHIVMSYESLSSELKERYSDWISDYLILRELENE